MQVRPIDPEKKLSLIDHLDELRNRLIIYLLVLAAGFGICFWQRHLLLTWLNKPLRGLHPLTLGVGEPFSVTFSVCAYAAIVLTLPVLLYQIFAFILPAFSKADQKSLGPILFLIPFLFALGVGFSYLVILPPAIKFLLNFNPKDFHTEIRAKDYYNFVSLSLLSVGLMFQVPVAILALVRGGVVSVISLRKHRRYAIVGAGIIALVLPGVDPLSMVLEMLPLLFLYELGIILAARIKPNLANKSGV